jgi:hypothetical protein
VLASATVISVLIMLGPCQSQSGGMSSLHRSLIIALAASLGGVLLLSIGIVGMLAPSNPMASVARSDGSECSGRMAVLQAQSEEGLALVRHSVQIGRRTSCRANTTLLTVPYG